MTLVREEGSLILKSSTNIQALFLTRNKQTNTNFSKVFRQIFTNTTPLFNISTNLQEKWLNVKGGKLSSGWVCVGSKHPS